VSPLIGRGLAAEDEQVVRPSVIVVSHAFWQRRFGGDMAVLTNEAVVDGRRCQIIGVMPAGFEFPFAADIWAPLPMLDEGYTSRSAHFLRAIGRLRDGASIEQAQAEVNALAGDLALQYPATNADWRLSLRSLHDQMTGQARPMLRLLTGAVMFVLLLTCVNVSGLVLTRNVRRRREIAIRQSLGATHADVLRLVLAESLLLSFAAAALGALASMASASAIAASIPGLPTFLSPATTRVLVFTSLVSLIAGVGISVLPASQVARDPMTALGGGTRATSAHTRRAHSVLAVSQVALALVLLSGAGLMVHSFQKLLNVPLGFSPQNVTTLQVSLPSAKYARREDVRVFFGSLMDKLEGLPAIEAASVIDTLPLGGLGNDNGFTIQEIPPADPRRVETADYRQVGSRYFEALGVAVLRGREFSAREAQSRAPVIVVSESLVRQFLPNTDPIGKHLVTGGVSYEIIGVVGDVLHRGLDEPPYRTMYVPSLDASETTLVVRSPLAREPLLQMIRAQVRQLDRDLPLPGARTMEDLVDDAARQRRVSTSAVAGFAAAALVLAALGIYGVIALSVSARSREIGVRLAIGATPGDVRRMVVRQGLWVATLGIAVGVPIAWMASRSLRTLLFGVQPHDPGPFVIVTALLLMVALAASYIPAARAARIDPAAVMKES
jgi:putative ABC transport system permease protein